MATVSNNAVGKKKAEPRGRSASAQLPTVRASLKEHVVSSVAVTTPSHTETMRKFIALHEDLELAFLSEPPEYKAAWGKAGWEAAA